MSRDATARRVRTDVSPGVTCVSIEDGIDYSDGYRVTVGWSKADQTWYAELRGCTAENPVLGDGETKQEALLSLCCSLAALADALDDWPGKAER